MIYNVFGQEIYNEFISNQGDISDEIYFLHLRTEQGRSNKKQISKKHC